MKNLFVVGICFVTHAVLEIGKVLVGETGGKETTGEI